MGIFNREHKREQQAEERQMDFTREQNAFQSIANPEDDQLFVQQQEQKNDLLKWQQDLQDELTRLRYRLKNFILTEDGWKIKKNLVRRKDGSPFFVEAPPLINDGGITMIESAIEPFISRNLINSNLQEERILLMLKRTCRSIKNDLVMNYDTYEVNPLNPTTFSRVMSLVKNTIIPTPYRALGGWNKRMDNTMSKRLETIVPEGAQKQQKRGLFNFGGFR